VKTAILPGVGVLAIGRRHSGVAATSRLIRCLTRESCSWSMEVAPK
jgi:hypothetical protein